MESTQLNKIAYSHTSQDLKQFEKLGYKNYVEEQLNPNDAQDYPAVAQRLSTLKIHIEYDEKGKKVNEQRPIQHLNKSLTALWRDLYKETMPYQEKVQPAIEVAMATWIRAVYSRWQLREIMVLFWHNHFNVSLDKDERIGITFPAYDREVIRRHAFGNFRAFLEDVAKSAAMQYYLNNASSQASPANENYARELFELHTLGKDAYLNHLYNRWREVPGAANGKPTGYIDEDVYEAARAFTGWTVADGSDNDKGGNLPNTGAFHYFEGWHDNYQKRVLGVEFSPNQPPMMDGQQVLDLVAFHPATARFICKKLCQRLISDTITDMPRDNREGVLQKAVDVFMKTQKAPDQLKQVIRTILLSEECQNSTGQKTKTPFELVASFLRTTEADFTPTNDFLWMMNQTGYTLFEWQTPTGHPDKAIYWLNPNMMLQRWNILNVLCSDWQKVIKWDVAKIIAKPQSLKVVEIADFLVKKMLNLSNEKPNTVTPSRAEAESIKEGIKLRSTVANFIADGGNIEEVYLHDAADLENKILKSITLIGMSPLFQVR
jgi:uncharacterized protein (DUF1800 family)